MPPICPACSSRKGFYVSDFVAAPLVNLETGSLHGSQQIPMLPVLCKNCGHIRFFSAVVMELVSSQLSPTSPPTSPEAATQP